MQSLEWGILIPHRDPTLPLLFSRQSHVLNFCLSIFLNAIFFPSTASCATFWGESHLLGRGKILYPVNKFAFSRIPRNILGQIPDPKKTLPDIFHGGDQFDLKSNFVNLLFKKEMSRVQSEEFISGYCGLSASVWTV